MKKQLLGFCTLLTATTLVCTTALAQSAGSATPPSGGPGGSGKGFEEHKAREIARIQAHLACVQAAQDHAALRACNEHHGQPR